MKEKNVFVEILESENGDRTFIVREPLPQQPAKCLLVSDDSNEVATFLNDIKM